MKIAIPGTFDAPDIGDAGEPSVPPEPQEPEPFVRTWPVKQKLRVAGRIREGLRLSTLGHAYEEKAVQALRRSVIEAVEAELGPPPWPLHVDTAIQTAMRWEQKALVAANLLRNEGPLKLEQKLLLLDAIAKSSTERDKALDRLGLAQSAGVKSTGGGIFAGVVIASQTPPEPAPNGHVQQFETQAADSPARPDAADGSPTGSTDAAGPVEPDR